MQDPLCASDAGIGIAARLIPRAKRFLGTFPALPRNDLSRGRDISGLLFHFLSNCEDAGGGLVVRGREDARARNRHGKRVETNVEAGIRRAPGSEIAIGEAAEGAAANSGL